MTDLLNADADDPLFSMNLRPGGTTSLFSGFGKGAGFAIKPRSQPLGESEPSVRRKREDGKSIKYTKEFLMAFSQEYTKIPASLEGSKLEIFGREEEAEPEGTVTTPADEDSRDWRARTTAAPQNTPPPKDEESAKKTKGQDAKVGSGSDRWTTTAPDRAAPEGNKESEKIQTAADIGRTAWMPGQASAAGQANNLKKIKGILNKLTPEKFERLLAQMVELVTSAEVLRGSITYIFENAVAQPTFVQMYADLCSRLSEVLPDFPPGDGETKPQTFRRILLNTCQEEYEGAANARDSLADIEDPRERLIQERSVKMRVMGNVRLIGHLHKIKVVNEKIIHLCTRELLGDDPKIVPLEDNIEAVCEIVSIVGSTLSNSTQPNSKKFLDGYMARLEKLAKSKSISSRVRFLIKDLHDMRTNNWVPRREKMTAKKLSEVHAQAQADLGIVLPGLQGNTGLPTLHLPQMGSGKPIDIDNDLLPSNFKSDEDGWEMVGKGGKKNMVEMAGKQVNSAFVGEFIPLPNRASAPAATSGGTGIKLTPEAMEDKTKSLLNEFVAVFDVGEAVLCIKELNAPEFMSTVVEMVFSKLFDCTRDKEHTALVDLLVQLCKRNVCTKEDLVAGLRKQTDCLEDLRLDVPLAPKLLGTFVALAIVEGVLGMDDLRDACNGNEDTSGETKRALSFEVFSAVKQKGGNLGEMASAAGVKGSEFLSADPDLDPPDLPSVKDWLSQNGFEGIQA